MSLSENAEQKIPAEPVEQAATAEVSTPTEPEDPGGCCSCKQPVGDSFYEVNGQPFCLACHAALHNALFARAGFASRVLRSLLFGGIAALVGALIYYAIAAATGYEFGLVGILIGYAVGTGVRKGSGGRGGKAYQILAVTLTYCAIVSTYTPDLWKAMKQASGQKQEVRSEAATAHGASHGIVASTQTAGKVPAQAEAETSPMEPLDFGQLFWALATLVGIILAAPFLAGFQNIIGWVILGFSVYEAWKLNHRPPITIRGPLPRGGT